MDIRNVIRVTVFLSIFSCWTHSQELNARGRNVCELGLSFQCCSGWAQQGDECLTPICEGNFTCNENEVCVRPNECRCRHGYFGATCDMKCPSQFWGPDCKGKCTCHPNGRCDDVTGACTCNPNRWGLNCERACNCQKGSCSQDTGVCTCYPGFWGTQCSNNCYCAVNSVCDLNTGQCHCNPGWYARQCNGQCACNGSPCEQLTGRCKCREKLWGTHCERMCQCINGRCNQVDGSCTCRPGFRGRFCREPCPAGFYGLNCRNRCGHCKGQQPCKVTEGRCITCDRGWNGTRCDQMCSPGFFGENCVEVCPPCKDGHFCNRIDGKCRHCNPGWTGDKCEVTCPNGTYGENCANECSSCFNGVCHSATGECLCDPGFNGTYCNVSCSAGQYGVNCAQICTCHGNNCNPVSGACHLQPNQRMGVMAAGVLVSALLLLLLLSLLCCCCIYRQDKNNSAEKKPRRRLCGGFTRISSKLPRIPLRRQKLPKVVVSHHDPENTFNCSFIDPPSAVEHPSPSLSTRGSCSSVETTEDGPIYSVLHDGSVEENKSNGERNNTTDTTVLADDDDIPEVDSSPEIQDTIQDAFEQASGNTGELPCQTSCDSEESCSGSESASSTTLPLGTQQSQQSNKGQEKKNNEKDNGKLVCPEKVRPRPPDPSTKPKISWIHASTGPNQNHISQGETVVEESNSSRKKTCKQMSLSPQESTGIDEASSASEKKQHKTRPGLVQIENINGAVQSVLRKMGNFRADRRAANSKDIPPKSPSSSHNREVIQPSHVNSEAASLLAAQLKEKTQSLNRNEGISSEESSLCLSDLQAKRQKPMPPQKTCQSSTNNQHGAGKALLPTFTSFQKPVSSGTPSNDYSGSLERGDPTLRKTPIKKPPRKKKKEGNSDSKIKIDPKVAVIPPQAVN